MTAQPQFSQFGAPPSPPPGAARVLARLKSIATGGALVSIIAMGFQVILPEPYRPSDILGSAGGSAEKHEMLAKQDAKIAYERGVADATAQAQAKAQIDVAVIQKTMETRAEALQGQSGMASFADALCIGGSLMAALGSQNTGADLHSGAVQVARTACGAGDQLRTNITNSQLDAIRTVAAERGSPMANGAVQTVGIPPLAAPQAPRPIVIPASPYSQPTPRPAPRISADAREDLRAYAETLPVTVRQSFSQGLDSSRTTYWANFYDRVADYRAAHPGT